MGPTDSVVARTNAVSVIVDTRHTGSSETAVTVRLAYAGLRGRCKCGGNRRLGNAPTSSRWDKGHDRWSWYIPSASSSPWSYSRYLGSACEQWVSSFSLRTDAFEAAKGVDATGICPTDTTTSQALVNIIAMCERVSVKTCRAAALQFLSRTEALGICAAACCRTLGLVLGTRGVGVPIETRIAHTLVGHRVCAMSSSTTAWHTDWWKDGWDAHDFRVAKKVG